jgi:hypothetical protein
VPVTGSGNQPTIPTWRPTIPAIVSQIKPLPLHLIRRFQRARGGRDFDTITLLVHWRILKEKNARIFQQEII